MTNQASTSIYRHQPSRLAPIAAGAEAARLLAAPDFRGKVLAVAAGTLYIEGQDGQIAGLSQSPIAGHTRMVIVESRPGQDFSQEDWDCPVWGDGRELMIGDRFWIDTHSLPVMNTSLPGPEEVRPMSQLPAAVREALQAAADCQRGENLGLLLGPIATAAATGLPMRGVPPSLSSPTLTAALQQAWQVAKRCHGGHTLGVSQRLEALVGLGPGLTPSGDDFVGGFLFGRQSLRRAYREGIWWPDRDTWQVPGQWDTPAHWGTLTNRISHAFLKDFANGQGPAALHSLVRAILAGGEAQGIARDIRLAASIGHSSGWDMLAGVFVSLRAAAASIEGSRP